MSLSIQIDQDTLQDCLADLATVETLLPKRHGPLYRKLEADLAAYIERATRKRTAADSPRSVDLGDLHFVLTPPPEITALLRRARQLRLIR